MVGTVIPAGMDLIAGLLPRLPTGFVKLGMVEAPQARHDRQALLAAIRDAGD
ncbi:hypothetical protein [Paracoccus sp. TOH]|uniref:hypothetical protein n=1 Tax=Paracoccus sp. TOH TaxID=1263728 RepID=UPI00021730A8|nr:hypothetical protein [Paracoccus sp. TOH]WJS85402.1 hypothetical protein NBE95_14625 [Paracoccus sp. TOH]